MRKLSVIIGIITLLLLPSCDSESAEDLLEFLNTSVIVTSVPDVSAIETIAGNVSTAVALATYNDDGDLLVDYFGVYGLLDYTISDLTVFSVYDDETETTDYFVVLLTIMSYEDVLTLSDLMDKAENYDEVDTFLEALTPEVDSDLMDPLRVQASLYASFVDEVRKFLEDTMDYDMDDKDDPLVYNFDSLYDNFLAMSECESANYADLFVLQLFDTALSNLFTQVYELLDEDFIDDLMDEFDADDLENSVDWQSLAKILNDEVLADIGTFVSFARMTEDLSNVSSAFSGLWDWGMDELDGLL